MFWDFLLFYQFFHLPQVKGALLLVIKMVYMSCLTNIEYWILNFSCRVIFCMKSKVSLKYFVHDCLVECESFDRFWTLRPLSQLYQKIGGSELEKMFQNLILNFLEMYYFAWNIKFASCSLLMIHFFHTFSQRIPQQNYFNYCKELTLYCFVFL